MFTKKVGTTKAGWSQHPCVARGLHPFGFPLTSHPGIPAHGMWFGLPHGMQTLCSQAGKAPAAFTTKVAWVPVENGITCPSAVTHGSCRQHPGDVQPLGAPQSASVLHGPKRFDGEFVTHRFCGSVVP